MDESSGDDGNVAPVVLRFFFVKVFWEIILTLLAGAAWG